LISRAGRSLDAQQFSCGRWTAWSVAALEDDSPEPRLPRALPGRTYPSSLRAWRDACSIKLEFDAVERRCRTRRPCMTWIERSMWIAILALSALVSVACGSSEVPAKQLAEAQAAVRAAREVGAEDTPQAALQLKLARDRLQRAQQQSEDGENEKARATLEEARLDAELAVLLAEQEKSEARAARTKSRVESLGQAKALDTAKPNE
jgi:hypothetical protein